MDNRWIQYLKLCNIQSKELENCEILEIVTNATDKTLNMSLRFPNVLPLYAVKELIDKTNAFFIGDGIDFTYFNFEYENKTVPSELLKEYYNNALENSSKSNKMITILGKYTKSFVDGGITFTCATKEERNNLLDLFKAINEEFKKYGLDVLLNAEISNFEVSITEKYKIKKEIERKQYETIEQEKYRQQQLHREVETTEFVEKKAKVGPGEILIENLPVTSMDVVEFKQSMGSDKVIVRGILKKPEKRVIFSKRTNTSYNLFSGVITNYKDSIVVKRFYRPIDEQFFNEKMIENTDIEVQGSIQWDEFANDTVIMADKIIVRGKDTVQVRFDEAPEKRIELHAHTKMSIQDSTLDVVKYVKTAKSFGHKALAVTDHNNCQVLPEFFKACKQNGIKAIAGMEGRFIDELRYRIALNEQDIPFNNASFVVFDIETTGLRNNYDDIIEIGAVKIVNGMSVDTYSTFVKPDKEINDVIYNITHISNDDVRNAPKIHEALSKFIEFVGDSILVAHNATFDLDFINQKIKECGLQAPVFPCIDTMQLARILYSDKLKMFSLDKVARHLKVTVETQHRALSDSITTSNVFKVMLSDLEERCIYNYKDVNNLVDPDEAFKYIYPRHINLLVKNKVGLKNFYKIISDSQTVHFYREPRILKSVLDKYREGLLVGTSCSNGEVFRLAYEKSYEDLEKAIEYYDYVEIQPLEAYRYLVDTSGEAETINYIKDAICKIIKAAKAKGKLIVATGDVHHLSKEDVSLRDIYVNVPLPGGGLHPLCDHKIKQIPNQPFLTTTEMLQEFKYLPQEEVYEYVVTNTNKIADMCEEYSLFPKDLFVPRDDFLSKYGVPSMSEGVRKLSYETACKIYGNPLPQYIVDRLELELNSIIGNGFSSVYYISHMLVKQSNENGYVVGSRGSVGSSFVATMMGITEVNPLKPHYICPKCHYSAFKFNDQDKKLYGKQDIPEYVQNELDSVDCGFDLHQINCPICKEVMNKGGIDIAFQTFLGFDGDKVPDIDLNFSGEYQERAHLFCREMFGIDNSFRAGTVSSVADKTAYGFVKGYIERKGGKFRQAEISRIAEEIAGSKRTTGQHPGGIVVVPDHIEYTDVTPVQYPADDTTATWRTTHYDYHSFESNLLKLDILGHDDPTVIKALMDYVEQNPQEFNFDTVEEIPYIDPMVLSLFSSKEALNLKGDDGDRLSSGTIGVPEFGTNFVREMLEAIKPKSFGEVLKVSGLSHGTDVWLGNASVLVEGESKLYNGKLPFKEVIGCRDDIMIYLLNKNLPAFDAFSIMERVRKGKGLSAENEALMREHNVPEWYIESCKMIKYLFPKAHATAYVMMALRIAWFKVYHPIYYYAVYFSKRAKAFDCETFVEGRNAIRNMINSIEKKDDKKNKDIDLLDELKIALEMVLRGFTFKQIDINKSDATNFVISDDKKSLYLPFAALDSLGEAAARTVIEARNVMPFTSIQDVEKRTKLNKTQVAKLKVLGAFGDLPEKDIHTLL